VAPSPASQMTALGKLFAEEDRPTKCSQGLGRGEVQAQEQAKAAQEALHLQEFGQDLECLGGEGMLGWPMALARESRERAEMMVEEMVEAQVQAPQQLRAVGPVFESPAAALGEESECSISFVDLGEPSISAERKRRPEIVQNQQLQKQ
jgi:RNA 3'-terminal phosphate cyclase